MKKIDKRIIVGICSIAAAALLAFFILPAIIKNQEEKVKVVRVVKHVAERGRITEDCVEEVEVKGYNLPAEIIRSKEDVLGRYATQDMYPGMYIVPKQVSAVPINKNSYLWARNDVVVSVAINSFSGGLSGKLEAGDIVSLVSVSNNEAVYVKELTYLELIAVTDAKGNDVDAQSRSDEELPATMTFACSPEQAKKIIELSQNGTLHVVLVYRGDKNKCAEYLEMQRKMLEVKEEEAGIDDAVDENQEEVNEASGETGKAPGEVFRETSEEDDAYEQE